MQRYILLVLIWTMSLWAFESVEQEFGVSTQNLNLKAPLTITLNRDFIQKETTYTHKKLFECSPKIDAIYKIKSSKEVVILPQKALKAATLYRCNSNPKYLTTQGYFEYQSAGFDLVDLNYDPNANLVRIEFNAPVDTQSVAKSIKIEKLSNLSKSKLRYSIIAQQSNTLVLKVNESVGYRFEVTLFKSLKSRNGTSLSHDIVKKISKEGLSSEVELNDKIKAMEILDKPRIIALAGGKFAIRLYFDDTIDRKNLKEFVKVLELVDYTLGDWKYIYYNEREDNNISSSYSIDIKSDEIKPNRSYGILYNKGLKHYQELKENVSYRIKSGDMRRGVSFAQDKPYLSNIGEIGFTSVNLDRATLVVEQVTRDNYRYFINYNKHNINNISSYTQEILSKELILNNPKNKPILHKFKVHDLMGSLQSGVYKVTLHYEEKLANGKMVDRSRSKVVFVSDMGIGANIATNQAFISLLSLSKALPIEGARVKLYSKNNTLIASAISDANGIVIIDKKGLLELHPNMIIVTHGGDQNFLLLSGKSNNVSFEDIKRKEDRYKAFVYAQSEIIRPSSQLNALISVKDRNFISATHIPIKVQIYSIEEYKEVFSKVYNTNEMGLIDFNYTFDQALSTGSYMINVHLGDKKIGSQLIAVESFIPPKIENRITLAKEKYRVDEFIDAKIASNYLFGMPSSGLNGTLSFEATHKAYTHKKYPHFSFTNQELAASNELSYISQKDDIHLNDKGQTKVLIATKPTQKAPSILKGVIGVKIMDDTQPVSTYKEVTIYPYKEMVGVSLSDKRVERGEKIEITPILIDPLTSKLVDRNLTLNIKKLTWHYRYLDGSYKWDKEVELVESKVIAANEKLHKSMNGYGDYIIEVVDTLGGHSATQNIDVWGWHYASLSPKNDLKSVEVKFEDKEYAPGDTLVATIKSPIVEGYMVVTLEKEKVLWHKAFAIDKGVAKVEIPISEYLGRGAYLHTTVVRKSDTSSKILPYRASSYDFVKSNRNAHKINISLSMRNLTKSHTSNRLSIRCDREATLLVSVVDVGILNMVSQEVPKIFEFFNDKALQRISYFDLYEMVMSFIAKGSVFAFGSDGMMGDMKKKKHLPPKVERVKPFMLWSKLIKTENKEGLYQIEVPQFNGRARVVVIATTVDATGVASQEFTVRDDIIVKPSYPRFLLVGDKVELPIRIFNNTKSDKNITLHKNLTPNIDIIATNTKMTIPAKSSKVINAELLATDEGIAKAELSVDDGIATYTHDVEFAILSPYALSTKAYKGSTTKPITLNIPDEYRFAQGFVYLSDNPLGTMRNDINYLINYPYGCAEQTSSKINAMLYAKAYLKKDRLIRNSEKFITKGVSRLIAMQRYTGLFSYWGSGYYIDYYASIYAAQTLLKLHKEGYNIDQSVVNKIYKGLKSIVKSSSTQYLNRNRLYAAFVLSEYGQLGLSSANMLYDQKIYEDYYLSRYYMSIIYQNLGMPKIANKIYQKVKNIRLRDFKEQNFSKVYGGYTSMSRDMALVFYLNSKYFTKSQSDFDTLQQRLNELYSTHEKALALRAIDAYLDGKGSQKVDVNVILNKQTKHYKEPAIKEITKLNDNTIVIDPMSGVANYSVELYKPLPKEIKNRLYPLKAINIKRDFIDGQGKSVDILKLKQGERIYSKVTIANAQKYPNMIINQRIPACLDIDNMRLNKLKNSQFKNENIRITNTDIRDDRVLYFANLPKAKPDKKLGSTPLNYATIYTPLMVTTKGECHLPAVTIEAMYDSRISDYAKENEVINVE